jgi:hypothetical protein
VAGSRNKGIQGNVLSPSKVERPSSSPPSAAGAAGLATEGAGAPAAGAFGCARLGTHAGSRLVRAQPASASTWLDENRAVRRRAEFDERVFFMVKRAIFSGIR